MCSSRTTGAPKSILIFRKKSHTQHTFQRNCSQSYNISTLCAGISLSHAMLLDTYSQFELVQSHDVLLSFTQLSWIGGIRALLWGTLYGATRIITTEQFTPEIAFRLIPQYKVSCLINVAYQMSLMHEHNAIDQVDFSSLKRYFVGGKAPLGLL